MGHTEITLTPYNDQGGDILCRWNDTRIVVQAKRWKGAVGNAAVQELLGAMLNYGCTAGMVVTNSKFTGPARALAAKDPRITLCDRRWLSLQIPQYLPPQIPVFNWREFNQAVKNRNFRGSFLCPLASWMEPEFAAAEAREEAAQACERERLRMENERKTRIAAEAERKRQEEVRQKQEAEEAEQERKDELERQEIERQRQELIRQRLDTDAAERASGPKWFREVIGQKAVVERLQVLVRASKKLKEPLGHILFDGSAGTGKSLGVAMQMTSGPEVMGPGDILPFLTHATDGSILFIDEIDRLPRVVEEFIYSAVEDFRVDIVLGEGMNVRTISMPIKHFTVIGATARIGALSSRMRGCFKSHEHLDRCTAQELAEVEMAKARRLNEVVASEDESDRRRSGQERQNPEIGAADRER